MWGFLLLSLLAAQFANVVGRCDQQKVFTMALVNNTMDIKGLLDIESPPGVNLSGVYKKSFAYTTIKDRLPVILTRVIDTMSRDKEEIIRKYGNDSLEELKQVIGDLSRLKSELMTNKPLKLLPLANNKQDGDANIWNDDLKTREKIEGPALTWFNTDWLLSECYMYRRINQALAITRTLSSYDPFEKQKNDGFSKSLNSITILAKHTIGLLNQAKNISEANRESGLVQLLKLNLWGNRCDLSLTGGAESNSVGNPVELLDSFEDDLLIDDTKFVWNLLSKANETTDPIIVDIVLDNAGYELFTDLCVASYLVAHDLAQKVRFYVKRIPWFISDVTLHDFHWTIDSLKNANDSNLRAFGNICAENLKNNLWSIEVESFWTEPYDFARMKEKSPALYAKLSKPLLIIFKGDLNYRKLTGDKNWDHTTDLPTALRGFLPTNLVSLRTLKADVCVGLAPGKAEELVKKDKDWMITGKYGVIHAAAAPLS